MKLVGCHHVVKFFKAHLTIAIKVSLKNHLIEFVISEVNVKFCHDKLQLRAGDKSIAVFVEDPECLGKFKSS